MKEMYDMKRRILAATPLISLLLFLVSGFYLTNWQLGWTFFLLIPLSWIVLTGNILRRLNEVMPLIALVVFLWLGFGLDLWNPGFLVFLLIPLTNMIVDKKINARHMVAIFVAALYVAIGIWTEDWHPLWIMLLLIPIINTIFFPQRNAYFGNNSDGWKQTFRRIIIDEEKDE
jgi:hypothetical protein